MISRDDRLDATANDFTMLQRAPVFLQVTRRLFFMLPSIHRLNY